MGLLKWSHSKVKNLTAWEIWGFIAGRVLAGFGLGVLAMQYFPKITAPLGVPILAAGMILLIIAGKGLARKGSS